MRPSDIVVLVALVLHAAGAAADTGSSLGDKAGEGSTPFTGLAQAPEANLFTGSLTTAIAIELPPGRGGMTPQLALQYSSGGGPSPFGYGWDLPLGRIERSSTWGTPRCDGPHTDDFVLVLPTGAAELAPEANGSAFYRPKIEEAWVRAEKRVAENHWVVTDRSGRVYTFGDVDSARAGTSTPLTFMSAGANGTCDYTSVWALTRIADPNGNVIDIAWSKAFNTLHPATVRWGANPAAGAPHAYVARFLPEWRPAGDRPISHRMGVESRLAWRVYAIDVELEAPGPGTLVRRYILHYDDEGGGMQSLLAGVGVTGRPTQHFVYAPGDPGHRAGTAALARPSGAYDRLRVANDSLEVSQSVLDMNGDGLLDLVRSDDPPASSWAVYWGVANADGSFGFQSAPTAWQAPGNWTHLRNVVVADAACNQNGWSCTRTDTFDLTGDGIPDHVDASSPTTWMISPGRGVPQWGFGPAVNWPAPNVRYIRRSRNGDSYQDLADMNGDGLPDLVMSGAPGEAAPHDWQVWLNTGSGFESAPLPRWPAPVASLGDHINGGSAHALLDFNGDGLPDIVRSGYAGAGAWTDARCQASSTAYASCLEVYLNTGRGFGPMEPPIPVPQSNAVQSVWNDSVVQDLVDINGDGLPDWIYRRYDGQLLDFEPEWRVLLNRGGTLEPVVYLPQTILPPPYTEAVPPRVWAGGSGHFRRSADGDTFTDLVDVNGDGLLDHVATGAGGWTVRLHAAAQRPNLLAVMENGLGGTNTIVYRPSTAYDNTGGDGQSDLPFVHWVVDRTRRSDGLCTPPPGADPYSPFANPCIDAGHDLVTTYQYQDGRYDPLAREFRGFRRVVRATSEGSTVPPSLVVSVFAQEAAAKGRVLQVDMYAGGSVVVRREMNQWGTRNAGNGRSQIWLAENARATFDLGADVPLYRTTVADPPDAWGNVTHVYSAGLFDADRVDTFTTYAAPQGGSAVRDKPSVVRTADASGVLAQQWYYYDVQPDGLASGKVAAGNLVRIRSRLNAGNANGPQTRMAYDAAGNVTAVTDPNGQVTTTSYDPYLLHPRTITNPLGHVTTTEVDYRWALPARIVDPIGAETAFAYDAAGRRTCAARPGDSLAQCTTATTYHFATAPGQLSWVETAERQDAPRPPLTTRHHFDALGRPRHSDAARVVDGAPATVRSQQVDYDPAGRVVRVYDAYLAGAPAPGNGSTTYDYRLNGGGLIDPLGRLHRLTASDGSSRRTVYDGARTTSWDEEDQRTESDLDSLGRVVERRSYDGGALAATVRQVYDGLDRVLEVAQNGVALKSFTYDSLGRKTQLVDADSGTWRYGYDGAGNLRWQDDPRSGRHQQFCYDAIDRPARVCPMTGDFSTLQPCTAACAAADAVTYTYDSPHVPAGRGRLTRVDDGSGATEVLAYDGRGRRVDVRRTIEIDGDVRQARFLYQYDTNDRVTAITFPDGEIVRTEYDDAGQPIALYNNANTFYVTDARYDLLGRPTLIQHANGVADTRTYGGAADRHRLRALRSARAGQALLDLRYPQYSPRGLLQVVADDRNPSGILSNAAVFGYDGLGRLTAADYAYDPADRSFAYDGLGNLTRNGDRQLRFDNPSRPHQLTGVTVGAATTAVSHDANGNRMGKAGQQYTYDAFDRLTRTDVGASTMRLLYDHTGQQVASIREGSPEFITRYYDQALEVAGGFVTKWYALGGLRVASSASTYVAWETAALERGVWLAGGELGQPRLTVVLGQRAQTLAVALLLLASATVLFMPGGRRRRTVGITLRRGPTIGVALLAVTGTLPWPLVVAPPPALAGGGGGALIYHHHLDHLGSTQVITNGVGDVVQQIRYHPYGGIRGRWSGNGDPYSASVTGVGREFTGFQTESLSGLQYAGARFYDPELGSFLTHDPRSQFASPYSYGGGDPMNWTDPNGEFFAELLAIILASAFVSAAVNAIIAAAQGLPLSAIGKAAIGGAIAGAVGAGIGVVAAAGSIGAGSLAGTVSVTLNQAQTQLIGVAMRSAFSTAFANAAGQTAAAAGAPGALVTAVSIVVGYAASYGFDQAWGDDLGGQITRDPSGQNGSNMCSNSTDHTNITTMAAEDAGFSPAEVQQITNGNLSRDLDLWNNQDHFDYLANETAGDFKAGVESAVERGADRNSILWAAGEATHHIQDPFAMGHSLPGTSFLRGPVAAPLRFLIHNAVGGEISFRQASYDATLRYLREVHSGLAGAS